MEAVSLPKFHQTIYDLPLNKFIDCIVDNNLSALIISGLPEQKQLDDAWEVILSQYSESVGTQEYRLFCELYKETAVLKIIIDQINIALNILEVIYDEFFASEVNKFLKTSCRFNWEDQATYQAEIKKCRNRSKALNIKLDLKNLQFEAIQKKNTGATTEKIDRQYFTSILITLSDHAKYRIEDNIKMSEYCERIKRFSDYCEQQVKKKT